MCFEDLDYCRGQGGCRSTSDHICVRGKYNFRIVTFCVVGFVGCFLLGALVVHGLGFMRMDACALLFEFKSCLKRLNKLNFT